MSLTARLARIEARQAKLEEALGRLVDALEQEEPEVAATLKAEAEGEHVIRERDPLQSLD